METSPSQQQAIDNDKKKSSRQMFTPKEDKQLLELVKEYGDRNWRVISKKMENRTTRQCRERYRNYLSPNLTNGPWTAEEDLLLEQKYVELGPKWAAISQFFKNRSDVNIKNRWASNRHKALRVAPKNLVDNLIIPKKQFINAIQAIFPIKSMTVSMAIANAILSSASQPSTSSSQSSTNSNTSSSSLSLQQIQLQQLQQQREFLLLCAAANRHNKNNNNNFNPVAKNSTKTTNQIINVSPTVSPSTSPISVGPPLMNFMGEDPLQFTITNEDLLEPDCQLSNLNINTSLSLPATFSNLDDFDVQPLYADTENFKISIR